MADTAPLIEALDHSSAAIRIGQLQGLLGIQVRLYEELQRETQAVRTATIHLLESSGPSETDRQPAIGGTAGALTTLELIAQLEAQVTALGRQSLKTESGEGNARATSSGEREQWTRERRALEIAHRDLTGRCEALERDLKASREHNRLLLDEHHQTPPSVPAAEKQPVDAIGVTAGIEAAMHGVESKGQDAPLSASEPEWLRSWKDHPDCERERTAILMLGETGISRRPPLFAALGNRLGIKEGARSLRLLLGRLEESQLVEVFQPFDQKASPIGGSIPDFVRLTERGRLAYWSLAGKEALQGDFDALLSRYQSAQVAHLVLMAADVMREHGFEDVPGAWLGRGGKTQVDLVFRAQTGETVEVAVVPAISPEEGGVPISKNWEALVQEVFGRVYVICENLATMRNVRSQLNFALGKARVSTHLTNLSDLTRGKRGDGGSIWLDVRDGHPDQGRQAASLVSPT